jgi:hypothetical protein
MTCCGSSGRTVTIGGLLDAVRTAYVTTFSRRLEALKGSRAERVIPEAIVCAEGDQVGTEGLSLLPARVDLCVFDGQRVVDVVEVDSEDLVDFEPVTFVWGEGLEVTLRPFTWDCCDLRLPGAPSDDGLGALSAWFWRWFDARDDRSPTNVFPGGVVHSNSDPVSDGEAWQVRIDLGSARLKAFEELMDAVAAMHCGAVVVGVGG